MALESKSRTIGDLEYEVTQLPYFKAQRLFMRLLKLAGPALTGLFTMAGAGGGSGAAVVAALASLEAKQLADLLSGFFEKLDPDEAEAITREILATATVRHKGRVVQLLPVMESPEIIGGDFWAGMMVQAFALSVHFGNFSSARGALDGLGLKAKAPPLSESSTSTGGTDGI